MDLSEWFLLVGASSGWASAVGGLVIYLHSNATRDRERMKAELLSKINDQSDEMRKDHELVRVQVADLAKTLSQYYVRRDDFNQAIIGFHTALTESRKEMVEIRSQLFEIVKSNYKS